VLRLSHIIAKELSATIDAIARKIGVSVKTKNVGIMGLTCLPHTQPEQAEKTQQRVSRQLTRNASLTVTVACSSFRK
jgi:hypothetical protein